MRVISLTMFLLIGCASTPVAERNPPRSSFDDLRYPDKTVRSDRYDDGDRRVQMRSMEILRTVTQRLDDANRRVP